MPELHVHVDELPGQAGVESEIDVAANQVRFRAFKIRRPWWSRQSRQVFSGWSGWFPTDEPIVLNWRSFDFEAVS